MFDILQIDLPTCGLKEKLQSQKERIIFSICEKSKNTDKQNLCFQLIYLWYLRNPTDMSYENIKIIT